MQIETVTLAETADYSTSQIYRADVFKAVGANYRFASKHQGRGRMHPCHLYYVTGEGLKVGASPVVISSRHRNGPILPTVELVPGDVAVVGDELYQLVEDKPLHDPYFVRLTRAN